MTASNTSSSGVLPTTQAWLPSPERKPSATSDETRWVGVDHPGMGSSTEGLSSNSHEHGFQAPTRAPLGRGEQQKLEKVFEIVLDETTPRAHVPAHTCRAGTAHVSGVTSHLMLHSHLEPVRFKETVQGEGKSKITFLWRKGLSLL